MIKKLNVTVTKIGKEVDGEIEIREIKAKLNAKEKKEIVAGGEFVIGETATTKFYNVTNDVILEHCQECDPPKPRKKRAE